MALSAAALSPYLGKHETEEQKFTHILTLLGMEMGANHVYDMSSEREGACNWVRTVKAHSHVQFLLWTVMNALTHKTKVPLFAHPTEFF